MLSDSYSFRLLTKLYFKYMGPPSLELNDPTYVIIKNMHGFIKIRGAKFIVGLQKVDTKLKKYLEDNDIPFVDLSNSYIYPTYGGHWTPEGHHFVSDKIYNFLIREKYIDEESLTNRALRKNASTLYFLR